MESEMIRDQLISSAYLSAVKDKLLLEEDLNSDKAQAIACRVEEAVKNASLRLQQLRQWHQCNESKRSVQRTHIFGGKGEHAQLSPQQTVVHKNLISKNVGATDVARINTWLMRRTVQLPRLNAITVGKRDTLQRYANQL